MNKRLRDDFKEVQTTLSDILTVEWVDDKTWEVDMKVN